ncbi:right-handed parallel beta-helix repeat-containing protein [Agrococcus citreus]|uniref:Right handed beta helix region n=1 Tax=Agrococcus citreus TaxID=84643 RepID=A0ABP4JAJ6_9MICO
MTHDRNPVPVTTRASSTRRRTLRAAVATSVVALAATLIPATAATAAPVIDRPAAGPASMPGPSNTGVPAGVQLRVHRGNMVITTPGTVISGLDIHGYVDVRAKNVTIRNSIIRGGAANGQDSLVRSASNNASLTITDSELVPNVQTPNIDGLRGWNINAQRLDIHGVIDPAHFWGSGNVQLRDSWIHDNLHYANDPGWNGGPSHDDGVQIQSGSGYWITGNRIEGAHNAAIMVTQDAGRVSNVMIRDNFLDHGGCTINLHDKGKGQFQNIDIRDNVFGANSTFNCQIIRTAGDITATGNTTVTGKAMKINSH